VRARGTKTRRRAAAAKLSARLADRVALETHLNGLMVARFDGHAVGLGTFRAGTAKRAQQLRTGLPLAGFAGGRSTKEIDRLLRRLARHGLLEYRVGGSPAGDGSVVIEPQAADYWPRMPRLRDADTLVLSRFAYMRRRGNSLVLESPRAGALFKIRDARIAGALAALSAPRKVRQLRREYVGLGKELLALLVDARIVFKIGRTGGSGLRPDEGDKELVLWDFHDLVFHARSSQGRHANPLGGVFAYADRMPPLPALRPRWPGHRIDLGKFAGGATSTLSPVARLLRRRRSTRSFDDRRPISAAELARLLEGTVRVRSRAKGRLALAGGGSREVTFAGRPYPSAGGAHELELYLAVNTCTGLPRGFYHYDAGAHALVPIRVRPDDFEVLLAKAAQAMGTTAKPQILITIAARFGRVSWKYSSIAYALILKNVGVLMQTLYLMTTEMGLAGCAIGSADIDLFARLTKIAVHVEGPVGQFAIGRGVKP